MTKRILLAFIVLFVLAFSITRIDGSRVISSNYNVLAANEVLNINHIVNTIKFHTPSFTISGSFINTAPVETHEGVVVILDTATDDGFILKDDLMNFNNNYMFDMEIQYTNVGKEVKIYGPDRFDIDTQFFPMELKDGTKVNVLRGR